MRRFLARASGVLPLSIGWNSPKPAAARCSGGRPCWVRNFTTASARAVEKLPIRWEQDRVDRHLVGVAVDAQHPVDVGRDQLDHFQQGLGQIGELRLALVVDVGRARGEQQFRLEHEAVALDPDARLVADDLAQPAEEFRARAVELLHLAGQGGVEALAEIGDLNVLIDVFFLAGFERGIELGHLGLERLELLVQQRGLGAGRSRDVLLGGQLALGLGRLGAEIGDLFSSSALRALSASTSFCSNATC